jgi:hypothetical protein
MMLALHGWPGGVVILVNGAAPSNCVDNLQYGALCGLFCYATFKLTLALLKHWESAVVVPDIAWGTILTAVSVDRGAARRLDAGEELAARDARTLTLCRRDRRHPGLVVVHPASAEGVA